MPTRTFPGRYDSLAALSEFVAQQASSAGLDEKEVYAVQLAVDEAATNIIDHAYGGEDRGDIQCVCTVREGELKMIFKDRGKPFVPEEVPDMPVGVPLEKTSRGGAGLFWMMCILNSIRMETS
jgi:serine/threonine-protein kinase RsbW